MHLIKGQTLLFLNEIIPLAIPYHSSPVPISVQSLKKIGKQVLKLEHGNEAQGKKISNDQELIQSDPISCPQNKREITKYIN